ncbi:MAG: hypothetical protein GY804_10150 [Alphaproteobacteria bacterium]|nr:hypothetical protein [Alphaproteobacteria bacterium]
MITVNGEEILCSAADRLCETMDYMASELNNKDNIALIDDSVKFTLNPNNEISHGYYSTKSSTKDAIPLINQMWMMLAAKQQDNGK